MIDITKIAVQRIMFFKKKKKKQLSFQLEIPKVKKAKAFQS